MPLDANIINQIYARRAQQNQAAMTQMLQGVQIANEGNYQNNEIDVAKAKVQMDMNDPDKMGPQLYAMALQGKQLTPAQMGTLQAWDASQSRKLAMDPTTGQPYRINAPLPGMPAGLDTSALGLPGASANRPGELPNTPPDGMGGNLTAMAYPQPPPSANPMADTPRGQMISYQAETDANAKANADQGKKDAETKQQLLDMRASLGEARSALRDTPDDQLGPIEGRIAAVRASPEASNLAGAQNTLALQAKTLLALPSNNFSDADRDFLQQVVGGKFQHREGYQKAFDRIQSMLDAKLGPETPTQQSTPSSIAPAQTRRRVYVPGQGFVNG